MKKSVVTAATVHHRSREDADRAAVERHQAAQRAAHHVMDVIDRISRQERPAHLSPMATPIPEPTPAPRPPMATRPPTPMLHQLARDASTYLTLMGFLAAFLGGVALGKVL
jgi:anti-sigma factor RsiW